jgi:hypothetical protein
VITNHLHYGIQNDLLILDFSKAFDKVSHKKLLFKLDNYGIRDATLKWIGSFLNNRMQQAVLYLKGVLDRVTDYRVTFARVEVHAPLC